MVQIRDICRIKKIDCKKILKNIMIKITFDKRLEGLQAHYNKDSSPWEAQLGHG